MLSIRLYQTNQIASGDVTLRFMPLRPPVFGFHGSFLVIDDFTKVLEKIP